MSIFNRIDYSLVLSIPRRIADMAWLTHVPFGLFLVDVLQPNVVVELGTHTGISYCAFCQAVKQRGLNSRCYAVDTWQGDDHAGYYGADVLADLKSHHDRLYSSFSQLIQSTFDDALSRFEDGSIDLLHLDGLHTYDAVRHDFETWLPKMSGRGVMLFHDTEVRSQDFGVWRFWQEVASQYPHFEFVHGYGLGVLAVGAECPEALHGLFNASPEDQESIRALFSEFGVRLEHYLHDKQTTSQTIARQETRINELEAFVKRIQTNLFFKAYHQVKYFGRK